MLFTMAVLPVHAKIIDSGNCGEWNSQIKDYSDNVTWTLDDNGTLTISGSGDMDAYPYFSTDRSYVSHVEYNKNSNIKNIIINDGVTNISEFFGCISLKSVTITVYDRAENKVFAGTFDDIKDYVHNGSSASRVIVRYESGSLKEMVVYND